MYEYWPEPEGVFSVYTPVLIYTNLGEKVGYTILNENGSQLKTLHIYKEGEEEDLHTTLGRLNEQSGILAHWPDIKDEDVQALLGDETWKPLVFNPVEVVDDENSRLVFTVDPISEEGTIDEEASSIAYKTIQAPNPSEVTTRIKDACEAVARERWLGNAPDWYD